MFGVKTLMLGLAVGAGGMYSIDRFHLVDTPDGMVVISRLDTPALLESYVNVRGWGAEQWSKNATVTRALIADGRGDLVTDSVQGELLQQSTNSLGMSNEWGPGQVDARPAQLNLGSQSQGMPEIIFGRSVSETRPAPTATTGPTNGSLLDRLQHQLQSNPMNAQPQSGNSGSYSPSSSGVTGAGWSEFQERPLIREVAPRPTSQLPHPSSAVNTSQNSQPMPASQRPIQPTSLDRASNMVNTSEFGFASVPGSVNESLHNASQSSISSEPVRQIVTDTPQVESGFVSNEMHRSDSTGYGSQMGRAFVPGVDSQRLQQEIPATVRDGLQSLLPRTRSVPIDNQAPRVAPF